MASRSKVSDQSWFYHAPSKPKPRSTDPAPVPPISQIPGLSNVSHLPEEEPNTRLWIRESDSDYIRLAKQGGRVDLLMMRPTKPPSEQPVGYPRCEWFYDSYTDPNQQQRPDQPYEFLLPDYMVHQPMRRRCEQRECGDYGAETAPYAFDKSTVYEREGYKPNDKTVKLEEQRKIGYGVRTEKQQQQRAGKSQNLGVKGDSNAEQNSMSKILSYGYASDYDTQRENYQHEKCKQSEKEMERNKKMNSIKHYTAKNQKGNPCKGGRKR